ncbi:uncharacterized protein LOC115888359 isoform X2 [Sitophilus oryzae]|uniref:Uncharacterized protein LOC115888359 isoform X2 n=1 Tax=Sitophilus oryzae TaxID=7048 RepID=A0A6J2YKW3_SITOR|nr:uncharacterized protein LOC115888359 isoform X2 [Sitophilus oryzae]
MAHSLKYFAVLMCFAVLSEVFTLNFYHLKKATRKKRSDELKYPEPPQCEKDSIYLCISGPKNKRSQMAIVNNTAATGLVMDVNENKIALVQPTHTIILDGIRKKGSIMMNDQQINRDNIFDTLRDYNMSHNFCMQPKGSSANIDTFAQTEHDVSIVEALIKVLNEGMMDDMGNLLPAFNLSSEGWFALPGGFATIWPIISGILDFFKKTDYRPFGSLALSIPLILLLISCNGLFVMFAILYELGQKLTLQTVLIFLITAPILLFSFIGVFGGLLLYGVAGVFTIIIKLIELIAMSLFDAIVAAVRIITDMIMSFFTSNDAVKRPDQTLNIQDNVNENAMRLQNLFSEHEKRKSKKSIRPLVNVAMGLRGKMNLVVKGVNIGSAVNILSSDAIQSGMSMAAEIVKLFDRIRTGNLVTRAFSGIFSGALSLLADESDPAFAKAILPGISLPPFATIRKYNETVALLRLPTEQIIKRVPHFNNMFIILDKHYREIYNRSLAEELKRDRRFNNEIRIAIRRHLIHD